MRTPFCLWFMLLLLAMLLRPPTLRGADLTAFTLAHEGNKYIEPIASNEVTSISSERSSGSLTPNTWYIDYYDSQVLFNMAEVKFVDGQMVKTTRPKRLSDLFTGRKQLNWRKLKIDSNRALTIATNFGPLKNIDLKSAQFWLQRTPNSAEWRIRFWAAKPGHPDKLKRIGDIYVSAEDGSILETNLKLKKSE